MIEPKYKVGDEVIYCHRKYIEFDCCRIASYDPDLRMYITEQGFYALESELYSVSELDRIIAIYNVAQELNADLTLYQVDQIKAIIYKPQGVKE